MNNNEKGGVMPLCLVKKAGNQGAELVALDDQTSLLDDLIFDRTYEVEQLLVAALGLYDDLEKRADAEAAPVWPYRAKIAAALELAREITNCE